MTNLKPRIYMLLPALHTCGAWYCLCCADQVTCVWVSNSALARAAAC